MGDVVTARSVRLLVVDDDTEPAELGEEHDVPADLVELHEILEIAAAIEHAEHDWPQS